MALRTAPVALFVTVTVAPDTAAPDESVTRPVISPLVCAMPAPAKTESIATLASIRSLERILIFIFPSVRAPRSLSGRGGLGTAVSLVIRGHRNLHHADRPHLAMGSDKISNSKASSVYFVNQIMGKRRCCISTINA